MITATSLVGEHSLVNSKNDALEQVCLQAAIDGDRDAFGKLVLVYQGRIYGLSLMMMRRPQAAEDVTQDAFIRAFTRLHLCDPRRPFYPWLATIAVRLAQNRLRQDSRLVGVNPQIEAQEPTAGETPLTQLLGAEQSRRLWQWVAALPSGERTATFLFYRQELSIKEVANVLGVTVGTVKTLLFRARRKLRTKITSGPSKAKASRRSDS